MCLRSKFHRYHHQSSVLPEHPWIFEGAHLGYIVPARARIVKPELRTRSVIVICGVVLRMWAGGKKIW